MNLLMLEQDQIVSQLAETKTEIEKTKQKIIQQLEYSSKQIMAQINRNNVFDYNINPVKWV